MSSPKSITKSIMLCISTLLFARLVLSTPFEQHLQRRIVCNADNCLRQLRQTSSLASPFCKTYLGTVTSTVTTTTTIPALGAVFPQKRSVEDQTDAPLTITTVPPSLTHDDLRRAAPTPSYVSKCTENPTALSSGCSCLLSITEPTTTITYTSTSTLPLPPQCSSKNNYGLQPTFYQDYILPNGQGSSGLGFDTLPGGCCAYCFASPNCVGFYVDSSYVAAEPGEVGCSVEILGEVPVEPLGSDTCPLGLASVTASGSVSNVMFGLGPCATVVPG